MKITTRQIQILRLLDKGSTRPQAAVALGIALDTVDSHLKSVFGNLQVTSYKEAIKKAKELNLLNDVN